MQKKAAPNLKIRAAFEPASFNADSRTVDLIFTTTAPILRGFWDPFYETLSMDPANVRMDRLNKGAALLNSHQQSDLSNVIGVVEKAWLDGEQGKATVRFSDREDVKPIIQDVKDGILRNISIGYRVYKYEEQPQPPLAAGQTPETIPTYKATDWEPFEISIVPVPADADAQIRNAGAIEKNECTIVLRAQQAQEPTKEEPIMTVKTEQEAPAVVVDTVKERAEATKAERARMLEISSSCESLKLEKSFAEKLIADGISIEDARKAIIDEKAKAQAKDNPVTQNQVTIVRDETETFRKSAIEALAHRAAPSKNKLTDLGRSNFGFSLIELARNCLERQGIRTGGMTKTDIASRAFETTSDLPYILENVMNKALRQGYVENPRTFTPWAKQGSAPDFKQMSRVQLANFPSLTKVNEHGEFKTYAVTDGKEVYSLLTYGAIVAFSRQALINDDLSALDRVPQSAGWAASGLESDIVYAILTANAALADSVALFHATHANLGTGVISVAALGAARALMRVQKGMGANSARPLNLAPKSLIVPAALETLAQQFTSNAFVAQQSSNMNPFAQGFSSALDVIVEPRLDATSALVWYLAAAPGLIDTIEYCYLEGQEGVYTETKLGFNVDGLEIKVRHDFAAKALDYRGLFKSSGA